MRQHRFLNSGLLIFTVFCFAATAYAEPKVQFGKLKAEKVTIKGDGFTKSGREYQVNFYGNDKFIGNIATNKGSFSFITDEGDVSIGDLLKVKVLDWYGTGRHYEKTNTVQAGSEDSEMSEEEIHRYADQQARTVANRVTETYGKREQWRYNFAKGFWAGYSLFKVYSGSGSGRIHYLNGLQVGREKGGKDGEAVGCQAANEKGGYDGKLQARERFLSIVDKNAAPDLSPSIPSIDYPGATSVLPSDNLIEKKLTDLEIALDKEMREMSWQSGGLTVGYREGGETWSLRRIYRSQGEYQFIQDWFRSDYAFEEWRKNELGGGYDYSSWNRMSVAERDLFKKYFKRLYDLVIDEKFFRTKTAFQPVIFAQGSIYGQQIGAEESYQAGWREGYQGSYKPASVEGFRKNYETAFRSSFETSASWFSNNSVLMIGDVSLLDENGDGIFEAGEKVGVSIGKIVNVGRRSAHDLLIQIEGGRLQFLAIEQEALSTLAASSTHPGTRVVKAIARIPDDIETDVPQVVTVKFGDAVATASYTVSWQDVLRQFVSADRRRDEQEYLRIRKYVLTVLDKEWLECIKQGDNWYRVGNTKLKNCVSAFQSGDVRAKENFREIQADVYKIQATGGGIHPWKRKAYRKLADQLK